MEASPGDGHMIGAVVGAAATELGLEPGHARALATAAAAVGQAIHDRGFDDPTSASVDVEVLSVGHRVVVHVDDLGLPFAYEEEAGLDGEVLARALDEGWVDEIHHRWRGRDGNRTTLVRHLDPGPDHRERAAADGPVATAPADPLAGPPTGDAPAPARSRIATPADAEAICRLTWRTYGSTYQHDEYYQPTRLAQMLTTGAQVSFVTEVDAEVDAEVVGHSAVLVEGPGAVVVEGGRAMVDPRYRGHHLMGSARALLEGWCRAHGVLALSGAAVTAHTRSQTDRPVLSVQLGFLPPIRFAGIAGTDTDLREAVVGAIVPMSEIPAQTVHLPARDAEQLARLYDLVGLERPSAGAGAAPTAAQSVLDVGVRADLGHAVIGVRVIGSDLGAAVVDRLAAIARGGVEVTYLDLALDDPAASWAADVLAGAGCILAGLLPLEWSGVDVVRYQHLGSARVDPDAIHLRNDHARELLAYVLAQRAVVA